MTNLNGKTITNSIADFEVLSNELKCFNSVLIRYNVDLQYFSGEIVRDVIACRLSKRMGAEFTNYIRTKGFMDETALYLPRLLSWVNKKIIFWQSELGCNLVQGNQRIGARRSCSVTSSQETKSNNNHRGGKYCKNDNNEKTPSSSKEKRVYLLWGAETCFFV